MNGQIVWTVTEAEANVIVAALASRPYGEVAGLVGRLIADAEAQLEVDRDHADS